MPRNASVVYVIPDLTSKEFSSIQFRDTCSEGYVVIIASVLIEIKPGPS